MQVETAEVQLDVIEEGIDELCSLESYMQRTHPPDESAQLLAVICCPRREVASIHTCRHDLHVFIHLVTPHLVRPLPDEGGAEAGPCFYMMLICT